MNDGDREQGPLDREEWVEEINCRRLEVVVGAK